MTLIMTLKVVCTYTMLLYILFNTGPQFTDKQLYSGSDISLTQCLLLILAFCTRHHLTYVAMADLLSLLCSICPFPNHVPKSLHSFWKDVVEQGMSSDTGVHYVCETCHDNIPNKRDGESWQDCPTCKSKIDSPLSYTMLNIDSQLESMFR